MAQKGRDPGGSIDRHELMHRPGRQFVGHQTGTGHGAGGQQNMPVGISFQ